MSDRNTIMRDRQMAVRREMDRRGILLKVVSLDSGIPMTTLPSYFPCPDGKREPAVMPLSALFSLIETKALPLELLSVLLPSGFLFAKVPEEVDFEEFAAAMQEALMAKSAAHHPESEAGPAIGPIEADNLNEHAARVRAAAGQ